MAEKQKVWRVQARVLPDPVADPTGPTDPVAREFVIVNTAGLTAIVHVVGTIAQEGVGFERIQIVGLEQRDEVDFVLPEP